MIRRKWIKRLMVCTLAMIMAVGMCGCGSADKNEPAGGSISDSGRLASLTDDLEQENVESREIDDTFISAAADFSVALFQDSVTDRIRDGENVMISPESVLTALAMTANGAGGDTLAAMEQVLGGGMPVDTLNQYMLTYNRDLTATEDVKFSIANSIWMKDDGSISVDPDFLQTDRNYYDADAFLEAFDASTVDAINSWVRDNTDNMIDGILNEIPDEAVMYLMNAIAFEGEWQTPYEEYQIDNDEEFTDAKGNTTPVTMLNSSENIYIENDHATGFVKPYKGGKYAFMALLPDENMGLADFVESMTGEDWINMYRNRSTEEVIVKLPEFSYSFDAELSRALSDMGMGIAFEENADFSRMASTKTDKLYINRVLHKTFIQVDRSGTKAAAVTAVEMSCEMAAVDMEPPKQVFLDRPFLYAIIDTDSGLPVFLGAVNSIEAPN